MLIDNYLSHKTSEFIKLAADNNILLYKLIPHLIHYIQPLDVGVFYLYKHYYDLAVKNTLAKLDLKYTICSFLRDLD
jgi:hypothetical protein